MYCILILLFFADPLFVLRADGNSFIFNGHLHFGGILPLLRFFLSSIYRMEVSPSMALISRGFWKSHDKMLNHVLR